MMRMVLVVGSHGAYREAKSSGVHGGGVVVVVVVVVVVSLAADAKVAGVVVSSVMNRT